MFTCTPVNAQKLIESMRAGDKSGAAKALNNILSLRDNMLGRECLHAPDWVTPSSPETVALVEAGMERIGELENIIQTGRSISIASAGFCLL